MKCFECESELTVVRENRRYKECGLPNVTLRGIEVRRCPRCGAEDVVIPRIEELHGLLATALLRKPGRLVGPEIRFLRRFLGWSGEDFAAHIGVARETVSRWENGHDRMSPVAERLLRLSVAHEKPIQDYRVEELASVAKGDSSPLRVIARLAEGRGPRVRRRSGTAVLRGGWELAEAV